MILQKDLTLTTLVEWLNDNEKFNKRNGKDFTISDVQGYIKRGKLPNYLGGVNLIVNTKIKGIKLYNLTK